MLRLDPPIPVETPKGPGLAHVLIDYGAENSLLWVVFLANREIWTFPNEVVRACKNITMDRP